MTPQPGDPLVVPAKLTKKCKSKSKKVAADPDCGHYIPPFVHFQQTIIREKLKAMSDEEAETVERHIEDAYAHTTKVWEQPWLALMKPGKSEDELEKEYLDK